MKILYLHQYYLPAGASGGSRSRSVAAYWVEQGAEVSVVTSTALFTDGWQDRLGARKVDSDYYHYRDGRVDVYVLEVPYNHLMSYAARVGAFIGFYRKMLRVLPRLARPDVIYASSTPPTVGEAGRRLARRWKIPFIFEVADVWPDIPKGMGIISNPVLLYLLDYRVNMIYRDAAYIAAFSPGMRDQVISHGVDPDKVVVSFNGTDVDQFVPTENKAAGPVIVLYAGTVGKVNDVSQVIRAAKELEREKDLVFHIVGSGNDMKNVRAVADQLQPNNVKFFPPLSKEEVPRLFAEASIGVATIGPFPVLEANSANKFYDYLASGLPVVINYGGWQAEALRQHDAGLASPLGDVKAFANNIRMLAGDPVMRKRMGENGRQLACREYDRRVIARDLMTLMDRVVAKSPSQAARQRNN